MTVLLQVGPVGRHLSRGRDRYCKDARDCDRRRGDLLADRLTPDRGPGFRLVGEITEKARR